MVEIEEQFEILKAISQLKPYAIDVKKIRIGPNTDGGYVFADIISPDQTVISYGISTQYDFDRQMAERGHHVYMFDHTIDGISSPNENMHFYREGVAGITNHQKSVYSISDHLRRHRIQGENLILKMDVEGSEYDVFESMDDETLLRFQQIIVEVHMLNRLENKEFRNLFLKVLEKVNSHFKIFHVHANNYDGPNAFHFVNGIPISDLLELSFVRSDLVRTRPSDVIYPTILDYPNTPKRDKLLWMYPFMPGSADISDFENSLNQIYLTQPKNVG